MPLRCADVLGIDHAKMNVNGGAISIGHPFGMTGSRQVMNVFSFLMLSGWSHSS